jgi:hypothetical protein
MEGMVSRRRSAGLLHIVLGLFLIVKAADFYKITGYRDFLPVAPVLLVGSFSLFYGLFRKKVDFSYEYNYWLRLLQVITFTLLGVMLVRQALPVDYFGAFVFAFLSLVLLVSEKRIAQDTVILMDDEGLLIPGYYRDHRLSWEEVQEVVVREDFITIFDARQKYFQFQVQQDLSTLEVAKMNAFCREKIEDRSERNETKEKKEPEASGGRKN